jgi:hypothetical protein
MHWSLGAVLSGSTFRVRASPWWAQGFRMMHERVSRPQATAYLLVTRGQGIGRECPWVKGG